MKGKSICFQHFCGMFHLDLKDVLAQGLSCFFVKLSGKVTAGKMQRSGDFFARQFLVVAGVDVIYRVTDIRGIINV